MSLLQHEGIHFPPRCFQDKKTVRSDVNNSAVVTSCNSLVKDDGYGQSDPQQELYSRKDPRRINQLNYQFLYRFYFKLKLFGQS